MKFRKQELTAVSAWLVWRRRGLAGAWVRTFLAQLGFNFAFWQLNP